jgi:hypothetical protein
MFNVYRKKQQEQGEALECFLFHIWQRLAGPPASAWKS